MQAPEILKRAAQHMEDRAKSRDTPAGERSMARTVGAFNALTGHQLSERDGWLFMVALKAARACSTPAGLPDDYEDGAAYFGLAGECATSAPGGHTEPTTDTVEVMSGVNALADETAAQRPVVVSGVTFVVPGEYRYVAQDAYGEVWAFCAKPRLCSRGWVRGNGDEPARLLGVAALGDWQHDLIDLDCPTVSAPKSLFGRTARTVITYDGMTLVVPNGYAYAAQDSGGDWYAYAEKPEKHAHEWKGCPCLNIGSSEPGDWRNSLIELTE